MHPQPGVRWGSEVCTPVFTAEAPESSGITHAMVLTVYGVLSPATNSSCHRRWRIDGRSAPGWADLAFADLTPATGARTTRFDRPQHCRSSCAPLSIAHELPRPATSCAHDTVASTASRTYVRDDRDTPLVDEAGCAKTIINFGKPEAKYFSREDWTGQISLIRLTNFACARMRFLGGRGRVVAVEVDGSCPTGESHCGRQGGAIALNLNAVETDGVSFLLQPIILYVSLSQE
jgi:hypothetical protein